MFAQDCCQSQDAYLRARVRVGFVRQFRVDEIGDRERGYQTNRQAARSANARLRVAMMTKLR